MVLVQLLQVSCYLFLAWGLEKGFDKLQQYGNVICQNEGDRGAQETVIQPLISCIA